MRLLIPSQLIWGLLIIVPLILYLFRRKPKTVPVSTLLFFKGGVTLKIDGQNAPCRLAGRSVAVLGDLPLPRGS